VSKTPDEGSDIDWNAFTSCENSPCWMERIFEQLSRMERVLRLDPSGVYPRWISTRAIGIAVRLKSSRVGPVRRKTRS